MTALYVLGALLVILLAGVVLAPLVEREPPDRDLDELPPEERRAAALEALGEVEFEYRTDKLAEEDYRRLRTHYGRIALDAEEAMEAADAGRAADAAPGAGDGDATSRASSQAGASEEAGSGASAGEAPADRDAAPDRPPDGRACPECGDEVPAGSRFCPTCGARQREDHEEAD